jgi:peptide/nickel transport system substrate-binding protein
MQNSIRKTFALAAAVFLTAACSPGGNGREPGEFRVGIESTPASLDPRFASDAYGVRIVPLLFNGLLRKTASGEVEPDLALSWERPDPLTHRLVLREGITFHDGAPLTSADVAATYRFIMNPASGSPHAGSLEALASVETPDARTVIFRLKRPYVSFPFQLTHGILPGRLAAKPDLGEELVGTGPFRLTSYRPDEEVVLTPFDGYFGGKPEIPKLRFRILRNATTRLLEAQSGGLDLLQNAVPPYSVKFLAREQGLRVIEKPGSSYQYLGFNLEDPVVSDVRVRRAVAHALDRTALIASVMDGQARPATGLFPPEHWAYAPKVRDYAYDPERAKRLLDEAGYPDPDGDGPAVRLHLSFKTSTDKTANEVARVVADQLAKVGIALDVRAFEWGTFFADVKKGDFQVMSLRWVGMSDPDVLHYIFHSTSVPPNGANRGRYKNPSVDRWIEESRIETDEGRRAELYRRIQEQVAEDCVYANLWWLDNVVVLREGIEGYVPLPGGEYTSLANVRLKQ